MYPKDPITPEQILNKQDVSGVIIDDSDHSWNIAEVFIIDSSKADTIIGFVQNYSNDYNMANNNCTTFSVEALRQAGISSPTKPVTWTLPSGSKELVQKELGEGKINGILASIAISIKSYSPGDAGEDLRKRTTSIIKNDMKKVTNNANRNRKK